MDIKTALETLDVENDDLWTDDGLPRVGAIKSLTGDSSITRSQITAADPSFCRKRDGADGASASDDVVVTGITDNTDSAGSNETESGADSADDYPEPPPEDDAPSESETDAAPPSDTEDQKVDTDSESPSEAPVPDAPLAKHPEEERADQITQIDQMISGLQIEQDQIGHQIESLTKDRHALQRMNAGDAGRKSDMQARMEFIKSQNELRASKHAKNNEIMKGLNLKTLDHRSPIDKAMERKTGRGQGRPMRAPSGQ